jgi:DUF1365 family protein
VHSGIYHGFVRHRRFTPVENHFRYHIFLMYLDLAELPDTFEPFWLWSSRRPNVAWFRRSDHLGDPLMPLDQCVRDEVARQTGLRPNGPIRLLTNLRYFGYVMNPVSYYYCFDADSGRLQTVLAEVHNTPWGERHCYVLSNPVSPTTGAATTVWNDKEFHVSPFMPMNMRYRWRMNEPGERIVVHLENHVRDVSKQDVTSASSISGHERVPFNVTMSLSRQEITSASLRNILLRHPCMTAGVTAAIYWQALKLWWKKVPFVPHPNNRLRAEQNEPAIEQPTVLNRF